MIEWFRSWHGAPTDPKWLGIAKKAGVVPGVAVAVAWALMDRASQADDRGSIAGYDADGLACFFGCEPEQIDAIVAAMSDKGMISGDRFTSWERRQPKREDNSSERVRAHRERTKAHTKRNVTQRNAPDTDTDTDTDTEKEKKRAPLNEAARGAREIFEEIWSVFPRNPSSTKTRARQAVGRLSGTEQAELLAAAHRYRRWFSDECEARERSVDEGLRFVPHLSTWVETEAWRQADSLPGNSFLSGADPGLVVLPPDHPDFIAVQKMRGKPVVIGNRGTATFRRSEIEQARRAMQEQAA